jgi:hypothetical protein
MDTMTYASFGAFRGRVAEQSNHPVVAEAEFAPSMKFDHDKAINVYKSRFGASIMPSPSSARFMERTSCSPHLNTCQHARPSRERPE